MKKTEKLNILVTGGAGYIGSHVVKQLAEKTGHNLFVLDNLSTGYQATLEMLKKIYINSRGSLDGLSIIQMDLSNEEELERLFARHAIDAVMHFAASIVVPESIDEPLKYYKNNTVNTINLIDLCIRHSVKRFIFSSTAAVYGEPVNVPIKESETLKPINPYGHSKLMSEQVIMDAANADGSLKYVILRYFNASGADTKLRIGERHEPETHLIPLIAKAALGKSDAIKVFGRGYPTEDGTCIRDYIHIEDLACAHIKALEYLHDGESDIFNCGYGHGYSVQEVISAMKKVSEIDFKLEDSRRREGDPAVLIADNQKIKKKLQWDPVYNDLEYICETALEWERRWC